MALKRNWIAVTSAFVAVLFVFGGAVVVGIYGQESETIDWELAGIVGTALGTTLLAAVTGVLAYTTWRDVTATQNGRAHAI